MSQAELKKQHKVILMHRNMQRIITCPPHLPFATGGEIHWSQSEGSDGLKTTQPENARREGEEKDRFLCLNRMIYDPYEQHLSVIVVPGVCIAVLLVQGKLMQFLQLNCPPCAVGKPASSHISAQSFADGVRLPATH